MGKGERAVGTRRKGEVGARIRSQCQSCGDVKLRISEIAVVVAFVGSSRSAGGYWFRCPGCDSAESRTAAPDVIELLLGVGVEQSRHPLHRGASNSLIVTWRSFGVC